MDPVSVGPVLLGTSVAHSYVSCGCIYPCRLLSTLISPVLASSSRASEAALEAAQAPLRRTNLVAREVLVLFSSPPVSVSILSYVSFAPPRTLSVHLLLYLSGHMDTALASGMFSLGSEEERKNEKKLVATCIRCETIKEAKTKRESDAKSGDRSRRDELGAADGKTEQEQPSCQSDERTSHL